MISCFSITAGIFFSLCRRLSELFSDLFIVNRNLRSFIFLSNDVWFGFKIPRYYNPFITDNEALAIEIELQNGDKIILATIYCPNGNPSLRLFRMINALSKQVIFLGDFNSKHKQFGCVKPNKSGQTLVNIAKDLKLFYVNQLEPNRHTREDPVHGTSDILDMAFITPGLSSRDISFSVTDDHMGSDHFPIQISLDKPLKRNTPLTEPRYRFDKQTMTYYTTH